MTDEPKYTNGGVIGAGGVDSDPLPPFIPADGECVINSNGDVHQYRAADKRFHYLGRDPLWWPYVEGLAALAGDEQGDDA